MRPTLKYRAVPEKNNGRDKFAVLTRWTIHALFYNFRVSTHTFRFVLPQKRSLKNKANNYYARLKDQQSVLWIDTFFTLEQGAIS